MSNETVLSLCDHTGNMVRPWALAGYACICIDIQNSENRDESFDGGGSILYYDYDVRMQSLVGAYEDLAAVFAFPPCTHLAVSGARWFQSKGLPAVIEALQIVDACRRIAEASGAPYMIENPVSTLSTYWRKPDHTFDPCDYGDPYTKKTCLWTGGGFVMPPKYRVEPTEGSKMHLLPPSAERANIRSATPPGFAQAVFSANQRTLSVAGGAA